MATKPLERIFKMKPAAHSRANSSAIADNANGEIA